MTSAAERPIGRVWATCLTALLAAGVAASSEPAPKAARLDPAARLPGGDESSEFWDLVGVFDSGDRVIARFMITNTGPGDRNAIAIGHLIRPDGRTKRFRNGRTEKKWQLSGDGLRLDIGSSHLDLHPEGARLDIRKSSIKLDLRFRPRGDRPMPDSITPSGYRVELLDAAAPAEGTIWLEGMAAPLSVRGRMALVHSWTTRSESDLIRQRLEFFSLQDEEALYLLEVTTAGGERRHWAQLIDADGATVYATDAFDLELLGRGEALEKPDYRLPESIQMRGKRIDGTVSVEQAFLQHDPLGDLPQPFRFLVALGMKPLRVWAGAPFEVTIRPGSDVPPLQVQGSGVAVANYLNPVNPP